MNDPGHGISGSEKTNEGNTGVQTNELEDTLSWVGRIGHRTPRQKAAVANLHNDAENVLVAHDLSTGMESGCTDIFVLNDVNVLDVQSDQIDDQNDVLMSLRMKEQEDLDRNMKRKSALKTRYGHEQRTELPLLYQYDDDDTATKKFQLKSEPSSVHIDSQPKPVSLLDSKLYGTQMRDTLSTDEMSQLLKTSRVKRMRTKTSDVSSEPHDQSMIRDIDDAYDTEKIMQQLLEKSRRKALEEKRLEVEVEEMTKIDNKLEFSDITEFADRITSVLARKKLDTNEPVCQDDAQMSVDIPISDDQEHQNQPEREAEQEHVEPLVRNGIGSTLLLLKQRGLIREPTSEERERSSKFDKKQAWLETRKSKTDAESSKKKPATKGGPLHDDVYRDYNPHIELRYYDDHGRLLDTKGAYKELSHQFHGKTSGKLKTEKKLKKLEQEKSLLMMSHADTPLNTNKALKEKQRSSGAAHLVLDERRRTEHEDEHVPKYPIAIHTEGAMTVQKKPKIFGLKLRDK